MQRLAAMTLPQQGGAQQQEQSAVAAGQRMSTWDGAPLPPFMLCASTCLSACAAPHVQFPTSQLQKQSGSQA